jgi:hypothetical protein
MTSEEEYLFDLEVKRQTLALQKNKLHQVDSKLELIAQESERQALVRRSLIDVLGNLIKSRVISLSEYKSIANGLRAVKKQIEEGRLIVHRLSQTKSEILMDIAIAEKDLEFSQKKFRESRLPQAVVLEFPREPK